MIAYSLDPANKLTDWRCSQCGQLLAKVDVRAGHVEIRCPKCKPARMNVLVVKESIDKKDR